MKRPGKFDKKMWAVFLATEGGFALDKQLEEGGCSRQEEKCEWNQRRGTATFRKWWKNRICKKVWWEIGLETSEGSN